MSNESLTTSVTDPKEYLELISKGAASAELKAPLIVPNTETGKPSPYRLCTTGYGCGHSENNEACFRSDILLKIESEFNFIIDLSVSNTEWGADDIFVRYNGHIYFYKPKLLTMLLEDKNDREADKGNSSRYSALINVNEFLGIPSDEITTPTTLDGIKEIIAESPAGLPPFLCETENFFQFADVCGDRVVIDNINSDTLNIIKQTFTGNYSIYYSNVMKHLYKNGENVYFLNLLAWCKKVSKHIGIFAMVRDFDESEKYSNVRSNSYFFPFAQLSIEEHEFVTQLGLLQTDYTQPPVIIYL